MPEVTVDLDDLEKLVFAGAAIKSIEAALDQRKRDPFVKPHLDFTEAHSRLAGAVRKARRNPDDTVVNPNEPLTDVERKALREAQLTLIEGYSFTVTPHMKLPKNGEVMCVWDRLSAKGCIVLGHYVSGVIWAGDDRPTVHTDPKGYALKITDRGLAALKG